LDESAAKQVYLVRRKKRIPRLPRRPTGVRTMGKPKKEEERGLNPRPVENVTFTYLMLTLDGSE
jgi:hypothetical protein